MYTHLYWQGADRIRTLGCEEGGNELKREERGWRGGDMKLRGETQDSLHALPLWGRRNRGREGAGGWRGRRCWGWCWERDSGIGGKGRLSRKWKGGDRPWKDGLESCPQQGCRASRNCPAVGACRVHRASIGCAYKPKFYIERGHVCAQRERETFSTPVAGSIFDHFPHAQFSDFISRMAWSPNFTSFPIQVISSKKIFNNEGTFDLN